MPVISSAQVAAYVFTSGSTGTPQPHAKLWGSLVRSAQAEALALDFGTQTWALVGTVPSQHMYGFESLIMLTLHGGASLRAGGAAITRARKQMNQPNPFSIANLKTWQRKASVVAAVVSILVFVTLIVAQTPSALSWN